MYNTLPIEIKRRYTQEELDNSFIDYISKVRITNHLYYNKRDRLDVFTKVIINDLLSSSYLNVNFSHSGNNYNARLYKIFFNGLSELYKDRITDYYNRYEKRF
jgi:ABC-type long-subunit fatty acid transport system fused permease/ATPase subunit